MSQCRSCGAEIEWTVSEDSGARMPIVLEKYRKSEEITQSFVENENLLL